jgi:hypothetical protein
LIFPELSRQNALYLHTTSNKVFPATPRVFPATPQGVSSNTPRCFQKHSRVFPATPKAFPETLQGVSRNTFSEVLIPWMGPKPVGTPAVGTKLKYISC